MLFRCHQMSMEREAKLKRQQQQHQQQQQQNNNNTCIKGFLNQNVPIVWVLGGPGSGKGTQCAKIIAKYKFTHLSTGDLLRDAVAKGSEKGKEIQEIMSTGKLVPNELVLDLLVAAITSAGNESKGFLIDGYPREKSQGAEFEKKIGPADLIIYLECAEETMVKRVLIRAAQSKEVRADDNETTIKERIAVFAKNTNLILEQYPNNTLRTLPIVWVVGGPGSGKGTQCKKVVEEFKFTHLSTGELLRQEVDKDTELGKIIKEIMDKGELVPTEIVLDLLIQAMEKVSTESKGYLIDGYPRTEDQGPAFEEKIGSPDAIMYIECKPETMLQRCLDRGREDDTVEIITERIRIFYENFAIIEKQYPEKIRKINGEGTPEEVYVDVAKLIREILANKQKS